MMQELGGLFLGLGIFFGAGVLIVVGVWLINWYEEWRSMRDTELAGRTNHENQLR